MFGEAFKLKCNWKGAMAVYILEDPLLDKFKYKAFMWEWELEGRTPNY